MDLVIGLAAGYDWAAIEPFAVSLVRSGFTGRHVLFTKDLTDEATQNLLSLGFELIPIPNLEFSDPQMPCGRYFPYVGRFLLIHKFLEENPGFRFVFCSDTRDVVFQHDPSEWMEQNLGTYKLVVAPEYILHCEQIGNCAWISQGFKEVESWMRPRGIYCSGFIAGRAQYIADLSLGIYLAGRHLTKDMWGADQPVYNTIMHQKAYADATLVPTMRDHYCINLVNLAQTRERALLLDLPDVAPLQRFGEPFVTERSLMWNCGIPDLGKFTVLHQYDRIHPLAAELRKRYRLDNPNPNPLRFKTTEFEG